MNIKLRKCIKPIVTDMYNSVEQFRRIFTGYIRTILLVGSYLLNCQSPRHSAFFED